MGRSSHCGEKIVNEKEKVKILMNLTLHYCNCCDSYFACDYSSANRCPNCGSTSEFERMG
jgi:hypothetical protein